MERAWIIVSILCLLVAATFLLLDYQSVAFVVAALGAVAWFLSYRVKLSAMIDESTETTDEDDIPEDQDEN
jgi:uncharacterized MnhB-related membrane protein